MTSRQNRLMRGVSSLCTCVFILPSAAFAQESTRTTLRTYIPIISMEVGKKENQDGGPRPGVFVLWGFEASHALRSKVTLEASYASIRHIEGQGRVMGVRGGYTFVLGERTRETSSLSVRLIPFAGYRYVNLPEPHRDAYFHTHLSHNAHVGLGLDLERRAKLGLVLRVNAGSDLALLPRFLPHSEVSATEEEKLQRVSFLNVSVGMAFYDLLR